MIQEFSERLFEDVQDGLLSVVVDGRRPQVVLRECCRLVNDALGKLQDFIVKHPFSDTDSEIHFQKSILPRFFALLFHAREYHEVVSGVPVSGVKTKRKYYTGYLKKISGFFAVNGFYYDYWTGDGKLLDEVLYGADDPFHVLQPVVPVCDCAVGTPMSRLAGMFMAKERLRDEILALLYQLEEKPVLSKSKVSASGELSLAGTGFHFQWKGEVINLIELAHGIFLTGQLEETVGIVEFFRALGDFFGVNLRIPKRGFDDLKKRKTMSQTHFCELMRKTLLEKMKAEDSYDPDKLARKNGFFK